MTALLKVFDLLPSWLWALICAGAMAFCGVQTVRLYAAQTEFADARADWSNQIAQAQKLRADRIQKAREDTQKLQDAADAERKSNAEKLKVRDAALAVALRELRNRPERPADGVAVPQSTGAGPESGGCTGAGLYRDDAQLLTRLADTAQRIREQRDYCYRRYDAAAEALRAAPP